MTRLFGDTALAALLFVVAFAMLTIPGPLDPVDMEVEHAKD